MIPAQITSLLDSLTLTGLPATVNPGDRIELRLTPDLAPPANGGLPPVLADLTRTEALAQLDVDASALVEWLLGAIDVTAWSKDVEFDQGVDSPPAALGDPAAVKRALGHLIPKGTAAAVEPSTVVQGTIGRVEIAKDKAAGAVGKVTGTLTKPGLLGTPSQPKVTVRVHDETGAPMRSGDGVFMSEGFLPSIVFMPPIVASRAAQPTVRRSITVEVSMQYTPPQIGKEPPVPVNVPPRTLGPFNVEVATVELPLVAILNRHPLTDIRGGAVEHVFVAVPQASPMTSIGDVIGALQPLLAVLGNVRTVLQALGMTVPEAVGHAIDVLEFLPRAGDDYRFGKGDSVTLHSYLSDWQRIMSAAMVVGPPTRRASFLGGFLGEVWGFLFQPSALGVGFIPDLTVMPIESAPRLGTAVEEYPIPGGSYDNQIVMIKFPPF